MHMNLMWMKRQKDYLIPHLLFFMRIFLLSAVILINPAFALNQQKNMAYYKKLAEEEPVQALTCLSDWRDELFAPIILETLAKKNSGLVLQYAIYFDRKPYHAKIIEIAARRAVHTDPSSALSNSKWFKDQSWAKEIIEYAARRKPFVFISLVDEFFSYA